MQPDLLSPEKEENLPELFSPEESPLESVQEAAENNPSPKKKRSKFKLVYLALGMLVVLLLAAIAWVGYWAYDLNTQLTTTQQQLAALQSGHAQLETDYESLKSENKKLNAELIQTKTDLEKANSALAAAQSDLGQSQGQNKSLNTKIGKASRLAKILYAFSSIQNEIDILRLDKLIRDSKDQAILSKWNSIKSEQDFRNFLDYLILATRDSLK